MSSSHFAALEQMLGYRFTTPELLVQALTHRSVMKSKPESAHNQRLEFLGDAVLGLCVAELLYQLYPNEEEGDLSKRLVALVNGGALAEIANEWNLGEYLALAPGEEEQGGRQNNSNLEDACEALLGAIYIDGGIAPVKQLMEKFWKKRALLVKVPPKDAKTALQEWAQSRGLGLPEYHTISADGPAHAPHFVIEVRVQGMHPARGEAGNKKLAERFAAEALLMQCQ